MVHTLFSWVSAHIHSLPMVVFVSLLLAGVHVPVSEDALIVMSALVCRQDGASVPSFLGALYAGALISDYAVYFWGYLLQQGALHVAALERTLASCRAQKIVTLLSRYGLWVYVLARFVPFGVRNVVSLTSGFVRVPFVRFACYDALAAACSISVLFWMTYFLGSVQRISLKVFAVVILPLSVLGIRVLIGRRQKTTGDGVRITHDDVQTNVGVR